MPLIVLRRVGAATAAGGAIVTRKRLSHERRTAEYDPGDGSDPADMGRNAVDAGAVNGFGA